MSLLSSHKWWRLPEGESLRLWPSWLSKSWVVLWIHHLVVEVFSGRLWESGLGDNIISGPILNPHHQPILWPEVCIKHYHFFSIVLTFFMFTTKQTTILSPNHFLSSNGPPPETLVLDSQLGLNLGLSSSGSLHHLWEDSKDIEPLHVQGAGWYSGLMGCLPAMVGGDRRGDILAEMVD